MYIHVYVHIHTFLISPNNALKCRIKCIETCFQANIPCTLLYTSGISTKPTSAIVDSPGTSPDGNAMGAVLFGQKAQE